MRSDRPLAWGLAPASKSRGRDADQPLVVIVDDGESVREGPTELIHSVRFRSASFSSTRELLESDVLDS